MLSATLWGVLGFFLKALIFVIAAVIILGLFGALLKGGRSLKDEGEKGELKITDLRARARQDREKMEKALGEMSADPKVRENYKEPKSGKKAEKARLKSDYEALEKHIKALEEKGEFCPQNVYFIEYYGDTKGSGDYELSREIDAVLKVATEKDEVVALITSPGGMVNAYGLLASQLDRIRSHNIPLTVCVDSVAASGGYMMAAVGSKIVAAPFAYIGSIGVVAQLPNFHRVLDKYSVDYEQHTAGKYKRTVTMFGENTDEGRKKFKEELEAIHKRFKEEVSRYRPKLDIENLATGEYWLASDAKERGLIDEISTSSEYLAKILDKTHGCVLKIEYEFPEKKSLLSKLKKLLSAKTWIRGVRKELESVREEQEMRIR